MPFPSSASTEVRTQFHRFSVDDLKALEVLVHLQRIDASAISRSFPPIARWTGKPAPGAGAAR